MLKYNGKINSGQIGIKRIKEHNLFSCLEMNTLAFLKVSE